jgi:F-type H+-transporting ATPase subunit epsilon
LPYTQTGLLTVTTEAGAQHRLVVGDGFVEVQGNGVRALVDFCNARSEIDQPRAAKAKVRAQERLRSRAADIDRVRAEAALRRAIVRLKAVELGL